MEGMSTTTLGGEYVLGDRFFKEVRSWDKWVRDTKDRAIQILPVCEKRRGQKLLSDIYIRLSDNKIFKIKHDGQMADSAYARGCWRLVADDSEVLEVSWKKEEFLCNAAVPAEGWLRPWLEHPGIELVDVAWRTVDTHRFESDDFQYWSAHLRYQLRAIEFSEWLLAREEVIRKEMANWEGSRDSDCLENLLRKMGCTISLREVPDPAGLRCNMSTELWAAVGVEKYYAY